MSFIEIYLGCVLGVVISVMLPVLRQYLPKQTKGMAGVESALARLWSIAKPYVAIGIFSLVVSLLIVVFLGDSLVDWRAGLLVGYAWDSTIQKIK